MGVLDEPGIGLERVATALMIALMSNLNEELEATAERRAPLDEQLADLRGVPYVRVEQEPVAPENFHLGNDPGLLDESRPIDDRYPNVCVMAYQADRAGEDSGDHFGAVTNRAFVETMVRASPDEGAEVCDKRMWRQAEAIHAVVVADTTLGGHVHEFDPAPSAIVSEVFTRPEKPGEGYGPDWFWQSARIEYEIDKFVPFNAPFG